MATIRVNGYFSEWQMLDQEQLDYVLPRLRLITAIPDVDKLAFLVLHLRSDVFCDFASGMAGNCDGCVTEEEPDHEFVEHTCMDEFTIKHDLQDKLLCNFANGWLSYTMYYTLCKFFNITPDVVVGISACQETYRSLCESFEVFCPATAFLLCAA